jgi:putative PIN family toxin of toxin-antitoxin system
MKVFFDTNVLVAAYATHGACNELLYHCIARHTIFISNFVLGELAEKLHHRIKLTADETALIIHFLRRTCIVTTEAPHSGRISRDHDDDHILLAALKAQVNCIITGDNDLLVLKKIDDIPIVKPADFWKLELREDILR